MPKEYVPNIDDLETVAENKIEGIDAALRHGDYAYAERLAASLIETLQEIQRLLP